MNLAMVVLQIRAANTSFGNKITGAAEMALAMSGTLLQEMAFVVQTAGTAPPNTQDGGLSQKITERFGVIVALKNDTDQRDKLGVIAYNRLHNVRAELFTAVLGWEIEDAASLVYYVSERLIDINTAWLWYMYEFAVEFWITEQDGVPSGVDALPELQKVFAQWALGGDSVLPLPEGSELPTNLLAPDLEELIELPHGFSDGFSKGYDIIKNK